MLRGSSVFGFVGGSFAVAGCILSCLLFLLEAGHPKSFFFFFLCTVSATLGNHSAGRCDLEKLKMTVGLRKLTGLNVLS